MGNAHKVSSQGSKSKSYGPCNEIEMDLRLLHVDQLKFKFVYVNRHPKLIVFERAPRYGDDPVVCIDLVYDTNVAERQINIVRFRGKTWSDVQRTMTEEGTRIYDLQKALGEVLTWCMQYQDDNKYYNQSSNNCRKFMLELCAFIDVTFPDQYYLEDQWYRFNHALSKNQSGSFKTNE
eukprot:CAMPEP_0201580540 /NCGR_PEP_ID=MMETSP0190_2-20130828/49578_1 /ASSEMBLY_ACC=CAM_ASM_000263 /TAXON_ID=37353 /ORGANISM="Rosalina sp." /LENGTH=177 /DNA_ID=CAMNT_0048016829 /DNA_START=30 /DNA_END=563 /DNA_ORIENTATION=+